MKESFKHGTYREVLTFFVFEKSNNMKKLLNHENKKYYSFQKQINIIKKSINFHFFNILSLQLSSNLKMNHCKKH